MKTHEGQLSAQNRRIAIVVARFNDFITERLLEAATDSFRRHGGDVETLEIARVPGAFELPIAAKKLAETGRFEAVICSGLRHQRRDRSLRLRLRPNCVRHYERQFK